uniref:Helicase ATP-binding domain-containing protein n=1 Tax=Macrostomum lignano TaxID=282301 RepID=A0A1I8FGL2_9PLAT
AIGSAAPGPGPPTTRCSSIPSTCLKNSRHLEWYRFRTAAAAAERNWLMLLYSCNKRRRHFLENSYAKSERLLTQLYHRVAKAPASACSCPSLAPIGFLRRGPQCLSCREQFDDSSFWSDSGDHQQQQEPLFDSLLDLGARRSANVTSHYAGYFRRVFATEMATVMTWRLAERGYTVVDPITLVANATGHRCRAGAGRSLRLDRAPLDCCWRRPKRRLRPGSGRLLLAVVVPLRQFCDVFAAPGNRPAQVLACQRATFEEQLASLVSNVLAAARAGAVVQWSSTKKRKRDTRHGMDDKATKRSPPPFSKAIANHQRSNALPETLESDRAGSASSEFGSQSSSSGASCGPDLTIRPSLPQQDGLAAVSPTANASVTYYGTADIARPKSTGQALAAQPRRHSHVLAAPTPNLATSASTSLLVKPPLMGEKVQLALAAAACWRCQPPTNSHWLHSLPKRKRVQQPRLTLTFRRIAGTLRDYQVFRRRLACAPSFPPAYGQRRHPGRRDVAPGPKLCRRWRFLLGLPRRAAARRRQRPLPDRLFAVRVETLAATSCQRLRRRLTVRCCTPATRREERLRAELRREDWTLLNCPPISGRSFLWCSLRRERWWEATRLAVMRIDKRQTRPQTKCFQLLPQRREFLAPNFSFDAMVVDEGHRLKEFELAAAHLRRCVASQCQLRRFILDRHPRFQEQPDELLPYSGALYEILETVLLRRIKERRAEKFAKKSRDAIRNTATGNKTRCLRIFRCSCASVEPEPFQPGEHLGYCQRKLILIDRLLKYLKANGHKVLMFSQMTHMLDILPGLSHVTERRERFPGRLKKELTTRRETFVFLPQHPGRRGWPESGQRGHTVIFVDSDFNRRMTCQAARGVHRAWPDQVHSFVCGFK